MGSPRSARSSASASDDHSGAAGVERLGDGDVELGRLEEPAPVRAATGERVRVDPGPQRVVRGGAVAVAMERATRVRRAGLEELVERLLEADGLLDLLVRRRERRIERAVEDERPHPVGERGRVERAQVRAVREPEVGELVVAERGADPVHVARRVLARQVREQRADPASQESTSFWTPATSATRSWASSGAKSSE